MMVLTRRQSLFIMSYIAFHSSIVARENMVSYCPIEQEPVIAQQKTVLDGKEYYYSVLEQAVERHWAVPISYHYTTATKMFGCDGQSQSIASALFGSCSKLSDIYIAARLADENLMSILVDQPFTEDRIPDINAVQDPFGKFADDIYLTLLAPMEIIFGGGCQSESTVFISSMYQTDIGCCNDIVGLIGVTLPIKSRCHTLDFKLQKGILSMEAFDPFETVRERTLTEFYSDYQSVEDFFLTEVLGSKCLKFESKQHKVGVGDLALFASVDFARWTCSTDALQAGISWVFPTGSPSSPLTLFSPALGDGFYKLQPFFNAMFATSLSVVNPCFKVVGSFSFEQCMQTRIARKISAGRTTVAAAGIAAPARFSDYFIGPFECELSATIPAFGDLVCARVQRGKQFLVGFGNYIYNAFKLGFRLGIFYDFVYKARDQVSVINTCNIYDIDAWQKNTEQQSHILGINLTYKFKNMVELNIGTTNVLGGKNVPKTHELFASLILVF